MAGPAAVASRLEMGALTWGLDDLAPRTAGVLDAAGAGIDSLRLTERAGLTLTDARRVPGTRSLLHKT